MIGLVLDVLLVVIGLGIAAAMWLGLFHWLLYVRQEYGLPWEKKGE